MAEVFAGVGSGGCVALVWTTLENWTVLPPEK